MARRGERRRLTPAERAAEPPRATSTTEIHLEAAEARLAESAAAGKEEARRGGVRAAVESLRPQAAEVGRLRRAVEAERKGAGAVASALAVRAASPAGVADVEAAIARLERELEGVDQETEEGKEMLRRLEVLRRELVERRRAVAEREREDAAREHERAELDAARELELLVAGIEQHRRYRWPDTHDPAPLPNAAWLTLAAVLGSTTLAELAVGRGEQGNLRRLLLAEDVAMLAWAGWRLAQAWPTEAFDLNPQFAFAYNAPQRLDGPVDPTGSLDRLARQRLLTLDKQGAELWVVGWGPLALKIVEAFVKRKPAPRITRAPDRRRRERERAGA